MKLLSKLVHWMLPEWYEPDRAKMSKLLTLSWGVVITFVLQILYFSLFFVSGLKIGTIINIISIIFCIISAGILKFSRHTWLAANIIAAIILFNTTINSYFTGGLHSSILLWITIIPMISIFILDRKHGYFWVTGAVLVLILFYLFFPDGSPNAIIIIDDIHFDMWINLTNLLVVFWISSIVIDNAKNKAIQESIEAREAAHRAAQNSEKIAGELATELEQRHLVEHALRESEERLSLAIKGAEIGLWDWNIQTGDMTRSEESRKLLGYAKDELENTYHQWLELIHPQDRERVKGTLLEYTSGSSSIFRSEHRVRKKSGDWVWVYTSGKVTDQNAQGEATRVVGIQFDITERKAFEEQLQYLANTDALTGLINRRHFFELAEKEFDRIARYQPPLSVAIFDIDHFKDVNDRYGHIVGDHVLSQLAGLCREALREIDIIARYGGEEFVILMPHTEQGDGLVSAERLRVAVDETVFMVEGQEIRVTLSMGVASYADEQSPDIDALLKRADKALYQAKHLGRNQTVGWDAPLDEKVSID